MPKWKLVSSMPPILVPAAATYAVAAAQCGVGCQWLLVGILHNIAGFSAANLDRIQPRILYSWCGPYDESAGPGSPYWLKSAILVRAHVTLDDFEWEKSNA